MKLASLSTIDARRVVTSILIAFFLAAALPQIGFAQSDPVIGTWKLNLAKSKYSPGPLPKSSTLHYEVTAQGLRDTSEGIDAEGKPTKVVFMVIYDGKPHPTTGSADFDASTYTRVDDYTVNLIRIKAGKVVQTGTRVLSKDGKTETVTTTGVNAKGQQINNVVVYDKQ